MNVTTEDMQYQTTYEGLIQCKKHFSESKLQNRVKEKGVEVVEINTLR